VEIDGRRCDGHGGRGGRDLVFLPFSDKHLYYNSKMRARARRRGFFRKEVWDHGHHGHHGPQGLLLSSLSFRAACCCALSDRFPAARIVERVDDNAARFTI
jgi:hypothetical protein